MGDPLLESAARKGSAELLILAALEDGQLHGYDIAREIRASRAGYSRSTSHRCIRFSTSSRIAKWIQGRWVEKAGQRRRRYYKLTADGQRTLASQRGRWAAFVDALTKAAGLKHA